MLWVGAAIGLIGMAGTGSVGWDSQVYWETIQNVRQGHDPYADAIAATQALRGQLGAKPPLVYLYSPLTLTWLRLLAVFPGWVLGVVYTAAVGVGALAQLWAGFQMAEKDEQRWLALALPAVLFFPGLITDDVILSGNVAYILYGLILAAAVPGWKRGRWGWYYAAVLAASIFKLPCLSLLAFPVLVERRQWLASGITAAGGVLIFGAQMWMWPQMFREYLATLRLMFDWKREFGFSPAGVLGKALFSHALAPSPATTILYLAYASVLGIVLLILAKRVDEWRLGREMWVPVALVGTLLLSPRIMKYDMAAFTVPMLLIGWRALRREADARREDSATVGRSKAESTTPLKPTTGLNGPPIETTAGAASIAIGAACFVIPNVITVTGPSWVPGELAVLLAVLGMGIWSVEKAGRAGTIAAQMRRLPLR